MDYLAAKNIIVRWKDRRGLLRDEEAAGRLRSYMEAQPVSDAESSAVTTVFESTREQRVAIMRFSILELRDEPALRVATRAGLTELPSHALGYVDRAAVRHLPFECAVELARAFARAEPQTVLDYIDIEERKLVSDARPPGGDYLTSLVSESRAAYALIRQWPATTKRSRSESVVSERSNDSLPR